MNLLLIIDFQNEFINKHTDKSIIDINNLVNSNKYDNVLFTKFKNSKDNPVYKKLGWDGCISGDSQLICMDINNHYVIEKCTYTAYNDELKEYINVNNIEDIYICGIDVECCVLVTALNLFENGYNVFVLKDYVYCMHGEERKNDAIEILKRNIGENNVL